LAYPTLIKVKVANSIGIDTKPDLRTICVGSLSAMVFLQLHLARREMEAYSDLVSRLSFEHILDYDVFARVQSDAALVDNRISKPHIPIMLSYHLLSFASEIE
jgi:hypothetical protein